MKWWPSCTPTIAITRDSALGTDRRRSDAACVAIDLNFIGSICNEQPHLPPDYEARARRGPDCERIAGAGAAAIRQSVADRGKRYIAEGKCLCRRGPLPVSRIRQQEQTWPGGDRHPGRDQEQQRDLPAKAHGQQYRGLRR